MQPARRNLVRDIAAYAGLAALFAFASFALTRCTMLKDNMTGVTLDRAAPTSCVRQCQDRYVNLLSVEEKNHMTALEECRALDPQLVRNCVETEAARHSAARQQLSADKTQCLLACTNPQ